MKKFDFYKKYYLMIPKIAVFRVFRVLRSLSCRFFGICRFVDFKSRKNSINHSKKMMAKKLPI